MNRMIAVFSLVLATTLTVSAATAPQTQQDLSKSQLSALTAAAKTPAEHERIAEYYRAQAARYLAQSQYHAQMAVEFRQNPLTNSAKFERQTVSHCAYLAESLKQQSTKAEELAQQHEQMAAAARQR